MILPLGISELSAHRFRPMKDRPLFLLLTFLPIALAIFFRGLDTRLAANSREAAHRAIVDEEQLPATILENARLTQYDISGLQAQRVAGRRLFSNDFQKVVDIELPVITFETDDGLWTAESQTGKFDQLKNRLSLFGSVTLARTAVKKLSQSGDQKPESREQRFRVQNPVQMQTEQLDYYPEMRLAETETSVVITSEGHRIESQGIRVDLANSIYRLPKRVRSTHEPL